MNIFTDLVKRIQSWTKVEIHSPLLVKHYMIYLFLECCVSQGALLYLEVVVNIWPLLILLDSIFEAILNLIDFLFYKWNQFVSIMFIFYNNLC